MQNDKNTHNANAPDEKMLSVCELARHLSRSERYVYQIKNAPDSPFVGGRAYLSDVIEFLRLHPSPCSRRSKLA